MPEFVAALLFVAALHRPAAARCKLDPLPWCKLWTQCPSTPPSRLTHYALCVCAQLRELIEAEEEGGWPDFVLKLVAVAPGSAAVAMPC